MTSLDATASELTVRPSSRRLRWPATVDAVCDSIVLSFAGWTVFYLISMATQTSMLWAGWPWIVATIGLAVLCGVYGRKRAEPARATSRHDGPSVRPVRWSLTLGVSVVLVIAVWGRSLWGVWPGAVVAILFLGVQLGAWLRRPSPAGGRDQPAKAANADDEGRDARAVPSHRSHLVAALVSIAFGVLGSFLLRPDADDAFYVNRATWVSVHGTAALNDTMFSPNILPPAYSGGLPTPSIEAAQGVLAHALGVQAPTLCYLVAVPLLGALTGWTTWRLIREWAPRRWMLVMAAAMLFLIASGSSVVGNYSLGRIWQGKATAFSILLPLVWMFLSRSTRRPRTGDLIMLAALGVAFVGLTTSSALLAPVIAGAAVLAALILRSTWVAIGAATFVAAPLATGLIQILGPAAIAGGGDNSIIPPAAAFAIAFNPGLLMAVISVLALALTPQLVPTRAGALLGCGSLITMATLLPGVFDLANALTGAGAIAWRLAIAMPTWVLVGLLVALPWRRIGTVAGRGGRIRDVGVVGVAALVFLIPLCTGTWLWAYQGARLTSRPTWKVDQSALADVRAVQKLDVPAGLWLMPADQMEILAISTAGPYAVVPRGYYLPTLTVTSQELRDRVILLRLVTGRPVAVAAVRSALDRLDVSLACVSGRDKRAQRILRHATGENLRPVSGMRCHVASARR